MAKDRFPGAEKAIDSPSKSWATITPHDSTDIVGGLPKFIAVGGTVSEGAFVIVDEANNTFTLWASRGDFLPIRPKRINSTGLTAGLTFVAFY